MLRPQTCAYPCQRVFYVLLERSFYRISTGHARTVTGQLHSFDTKPFQYWPENAVEVGQQTERRAYIYAQVAFRQDADRSGQIGSVRLKPFESGIHLSVPLGRPAACSKDHEQNARALSLLWASWHGLRIFLRLQRCHGSACAVSTGTSIYCSRQQIRACKVRGRSAELSSDQVPTHAAGPGLSHACCSAYDECWRDLLQGTGRHRWVFQICQNALEPAHQACRRLLGANLWCNPLPHDHTTGEDVDPLGWV